MKRCGLLIAVLMALLAYRQDTCAQKPPTEDEVKVGFIVNFGKYVEWPVSTLPNADTPITIGVLGDDSFATLMKSLVGTKTINGHKVVVKTLRWPKDSKDSKEFRDCHMLYIALSESAHGDDLIQMMRGAPTLTIADFPNFARHGGHINFILDDNHVRFEVNPDTAKLSDLIASSKLLAIAKIVQTGLGWR